jgi:hypothetical protein
MLKLRAYKYDYFRFLIMLIESTDILSHITQVSFDLRPL